MSEVELMQPRIEGDFLAHRPSLESGLSGSLPIPINFGKTLADRGVGAARYVEPGNGRPAIVKIRCCVSPKQEILVPLGGWATRIETFGSACLDFARDKEAFEKCQEFLSQYHPRKAAPHALNLMCTATLPNNGEVLVGALSISRLTHGIPAGRRELAHAMGIDFNTIGKDRRASVERLGVVWVSRIAVHPDCRGRGVGAHLLRSLATWLFRYLPWPTDSVELLQTLPDLEARAVASRERSTFVTQAGYTPATQTVAYRVRNRTSSYTVPDRRIVYYYAKV